MTLVGKTGSEIVPFTDRKYGSAWDILDTPPMDPWKKLPTVKMRPFLIERHRHKLHSQMSRIKVSEESG